MLGLWLTYAASNGILIFTLPLLYPSLIEEFGWNASEVTLPAMVFFTVTACLYPFVGTLLDRWSPKIITLIGVTVIVLALSLYPLVKTLTHMMIIYLVLAVGMSMGGLLSCMLIVTRWFEQYRGIAIGLLLMASSIGGAVFPLIIRGTLIENGWRDAIILLIPLSGVMMILPILFLVRNHPRDLNLHPDGLDAGQSTEAALSFDSGPDFIEVFKIPTFYLLAFSTATLWFCIVGILNHQSIYLGRDLHLDIAMLPLIFSVFFWCATVGKVLFGYLSDHFNKGYIMLLAVFLMGLGLITLRLAGNGNIVIIFGYAMIMGVGFSGSFTMIQLMIAEFFAGHDYGKILGIFIFFDTLSGALGIKILGEIRVASGSYLPAFNLMIGLCVVAAVCVIMIIRIHKRTPRSTAEAI